MILNQTAIGFVDTERGTLKESYFSPYIIPTVFSHLVTTYLLCPCHMLDNFKADPEQCVYTFFILR